MSLLDTLKGMTPEEITRDLSELATTGLSALGQPQLAALAGGIGTLALAIEQAATQPSPGDVLRAEVDAADAAADVAEDAKYGPKP